MASTAAHLTDHVIPRVPVRQWVLSVPKRLRWFHRHGLLEEHTAREMLAWGRAGGFSLDASIRIQAHDRAGLERLLRYCARPPLALERTRVGPRGGRG